MAGLHLRRHEVEDGELPMVCARCGDEATGQEQKTFAWHPSWMIILVIISLVIGLLLVMALQKTMRATLPFCDRHRNHFRSRTRLLAATFLFVFALFASGIGLMVADRDNNKIAGPLIAASIFGLMAWVILAVVVSRTAICPTAMTDTDVTLTGLSEEFVRAVVESRRARRGAAATDDGESDYDRKMRERRFQRLKKQMNDE